MDRRLQALMEWLRRDARLASCEITPASGDASFRRYFRVHIRDETYVAMDAPPAKEDCRAFVEIARAWSTLGLHVPEILHSDMKQGFLLLTDLGTRPYLGMLDEASVEGLYGDALEALRILQNAHTRPSSLRLPPYHHALLIQEMSLFRDWFMTKHLGLALDAGQQDTLTRTFELLARTALEQPRVWVHRDYHSRNLMWMEHNNPGILDFQDAVVGPVTYDLVSLLKDCYIRWPHERVEAWARDYFASIEKRGVIGRTDVDQLLRWFDWMGIQRHLKAVGIFARLNHRDGKPAYLEDIPRTLGYVLDVSGRYPEMGALHDMLRRTVSPLLEAEGGRATRP